MNLKRFCIACMCCFLFVFVVDDDGGIGGGVDVGDIDDYDGDVSTFVIIQYCF